MSFKIRKTLNLLPNIFMSLGAVAIALSMMLSMVNLPVIASTDHCPGGWLFKDDGKIDGSIPEGLSYNITGGTVTFNKTVKFCVKASNSISGMITGNSYTVTFENNGNQTPDISYVAVYEVVNGGGDDDPKCPPPSVTLDKSANPPTLEGGGEFTFTLLINNTSTEAVKITSLTDTYSLSSECTGLIGTQIEAKGSASCSYKVFKEIEGDYTNTASVKVKNAGGSASSTDSATISVTKKPVIPNPPSVELDKSVSPLTLEEPGGEFTFTLLITNTSAVTVTITSITDTYSESSECTGLIGTQIEPKDSASCTYKVTKTEEGTYENIASVEVEYEGLFASDADSAIINVTKKPVIPTSPSVDLVKSVDKDTLPSPGYFTFTLLITNTSDEEVTITKLEDDYTLSDQCTKLVGTKLDVDEFVSCTYSKTITELGPHTNKAEVEVTNEGGEEATDDDSVTVTVTDVETTEVPGDPDPTVTPDPSTTPDPSATPDPSRTPDPSSTPDPSGDSEQSNTSPTLAPPSTSGSPAVLIPVTGIELGTQMNKVQSVTLNLGLGLLGVGLVLQAIRKKNK